MVDVAPVRRRWALPALGVAVAVLFGYVATHRVPAAPPLATTADRPRYDLAAQLPRLTGDRAAGPAGLSLLVDGPSPRVLDAHTGRSTPVPGLRLAAGEQARLQPVPAGTVATISTGGASRSRSELLPAAGGPPVPLGEDVLVVPTVRDRRLLVSSYGPGGTSVQLVEPTGRVLRFWARPGTTRLLRDTAAGLVVVQLGNLQGAELLVLDPVTGQQRRRLATGRIALAVGPASVAHLAAGCARDCPVTVTALTSGASRDYRLPAGGSPAEGAFSPDGRRLALAVPGQFRDGRLSVVPGFAEVLDLPTGGLLRVPGVETPAERRPDLSWSATGSLLVVGVWAADRGRLGTWSPDWPRAPLRVLPVEPPGDDRSASVVARP